MSVSGVNPSSYSGIPHAGGNGNNGSGEKSATTYSIAYDRVSKDVYDKYDKDGDGRINAKEENDYKAEKSGGKSEDEKVSESADAESNALMSNLGNNIDIFV
ncbi:hypothetical protein [Seleniivibrio woodruffii]|uniref:hypothetical protein n=1 Tax=Seleniivibrio woodruffii TaxID=1078050 RepID=UPI0026EC8C66|nr:hypothetical protein [Seleniivibrio woodruffii]